MKKTYLLLIAFLTLISCEDKANSSVEAPSSDTSDKEYLTPFEQGNGNQTATYDQVIAFYEELADDFSTVEIVEMGVTDSGKPLHVVHFSKETIDWDASNQDKIKILVNNGIHPGESDGIDASMMLIRDLATGKTPASNQLILSVIPIYNVGGALNRNSDSRTNQNGPESYGFRGNARNYDLNRDFIKADTRNAMAFYKTFHSIYPDIFIDNHVSNGADYQYTLTHLFTQHSKLGNPVGAYIHDKFAPQLEEQLAVRSLDITPYVNVFGRSPDSGFSQFYDHPRYSTGYTALWNTVGFMVETHMLKPYKDRVLGTQAIMEETIDIGTKQIKEIKQARLNSFKNQVKNKTYAYNYVVDTTRADTLMFKGYEAVNTESAVTGNPLLTYDRSKPFERKVTYSNYFKALDSITVPDYYVIPVGQWAVIDRLRANNIQMELMGKKRTLPVEKYRIVDYSTRNSAYEGHYMHDNVQVAVSLDSLRFRESDILIPTNQPGYKYIIETLEPQMADSFFKWNFFDTILQQKEGFSTYVFEATALELLKEQPELRAQFDSIKQADSNFKNSNYRQLEWLHKRSPNYEKAHLNYPVYRYFKS
jgi:hypothetical protein